jgi:hypothetical protein
VLFSQLGVALDFQLLNGFANGGKTYAIRKGKKVALLRDAGMLFRTPELWKSLSQLGSADSANRCGLRHDKGQPQQSSFHSVTTVPAVFTGQTIIDVMRKA